MAGGALRGKDLFAIKHVTLTVGQTRPVGMNV